MLFRCFLIDWLLCTFWDALYSCVWAQEHEKSVQRAAVWDPQRLDHYYFFFLELWQHTTYIHNTWYANGQERFFFVLLLVLQGTDFQLCILGVIESSPHWYVWLALQFENKHLITIIAFLLSKLTIKLASKNTSVTMRLTAAGIGSHFERWFKIKVDCLGVHSFFLVVDNMTCCSFKNRFFLVQNWRLLLLKIQRLW